MAITLKQVLNDLTVAELKSLLSTLPGSVTAGRKDELIERIVSMMLGPGLKTIWTRLDQTQKEAVAEATYHSQGFYSELRFRAKYQRVPSFHVTGAKSRGYSPLRLFIHHSKELQNYFVPSDLQALLKTFVEQPQPLILQGSETPGDDEGLVVRLSEREAAQELTIMLRTLEQERVQVSEKTALPGQATLRLLEEKLVGGDFYSTVVKVNKWDQEVGAIRAFAWPLLLQAGGLATRTGSRLTLSPAGVKALSKPPEDVLSNLWKKWLKTTLLDEFSRIDEIKGQNSKGRVMTAVAPRREAIADVLRLCPVGSWITFDEFSRYMRATDHVFEVAHDVWKLYICELQYGSLGHSGYGGWNILQDRYISALLFEYAATLGILDVAYIDPKGACDDYQDLWGADELDFLSRYDGLLKIRLNALGAYILGLATTYEQTVIPSSVKLSVLPNLLVTVESGALSPEESLLLQNWAELLQPGSWRLDREITISSIEKGHDIAELKRFLEKQNDHALPESVLNFLQLCTRNGKALKTTGSAILVECRDNQTAELICTHPETASLCLRAGAKTLAVRNENLTKFRERIRELGFGMVV
jgi:hypothetical protein